jgi:hypothetical protein
MKTAMQELIEFIDYEFGFKWDDDTKQKFKELLEKEKEQIIEAYGRSICMFYESEQPEEYYNETYNQNK